MSDIRLEHGLPEKPEVLVLAHILKVSRAEVLGHLVVLWLWADQTTREGRCDYHPKIVDGMTIDGFSEALEEVGWLKKTGDQGFILPRIERYTGDGRTSRDRRLTQKERARDQRRSRTGKFQKGVVATEIPTSTDNHPRGHLPTGRANNTLGPTNTIQHNTKQTNTHTCDAIGDGDYTGEDLPSTRYYEINSQWGVKINEVIDAIPINRRKQVPKIKRSVAAALDRGVSAANLIVAIRNYYSSDEGGGEFATWPANWIDQERYDEDESAWATTSTESTGNAKEML